MNPVLKRTLTGILVGVAVLAAPPSTTVISVPLLICRVPTLRPESSNTVTVAAYLSLRCSAEQMQQRAQTRIAAEFFNSLFMAQIIPHRNRLKHVGGKNEKKLLQG